MCTGGEGPHPRAGPDWASQAPPPLQKESLCLQSQAGSHPQRHLDASSTYHSRRPRATLALPSPFISL